MDEHGRRFGAILVAGGDVRCNGCSTTMAFL
jgi:hypothetical protein